MASELPPTPRRTLTAEEKRERDAPYRKTVKEFGEILSGYVKIMNALFALARTAEISATSSGSKLVRGFIAGGD